MDKVECSRLDRWGWECPKCKEWNETEDESDGTVYCAGCDEEFEATFEP